MGRGKLQLLSLTQAGNVALSGSCPFLAALMQLCNVAQRLLGRGWIRRAALPWSSCLGLSCRSLPLSSSFGLRCSCFTRTTLYCDIECLSGAGVVYHPTVLLCSPGAFGPAFISFVFVYCAVILAHVEILCLSVSLSWSFALDIWISCRSPNSSWFSDLDRSCYEYWVRILVMDLLMRLRT